MDEFDRIMARHTGGDARTEEEKALDAELDALLAEHSAQQHASAYMVRRRAERVGAVLAECDRRPSSLTVLSEAADIRAMLNSLDDGEVLVVAEDGFSLEIVEVEPGQVVEGAVLLD